MERAKRSDLTEAALELEISRSQVYRLVRAFRENPVTQSLVQANPGPRKGARMLSAEMEEIIEAAIDTHHLRRERPTVVASHWEIRRVCKLAGLEPPSRKAVHARIAARPPREMVKSREGAKAARNRFAMVKPGLRPTAPPVGVQTDHPLDYLHLVDEKSRQPIGRPWLTLLLDVYSRCVLGFWVSLDPPSAAGVALAVAQGVLPKEEWLAERHIDPEWPMRGLPKLLHLDNAQEFRSEALKRGCEQHGIAIEHRPPGAPHYGGHIERLMGTLMRRIHALPGSTSSNVVERGNYPAEEKAVLTLSEFERMLALDIIGPYHSDLHSGLGKTPAAAWADGIAESGAPRLPADPRGFVRDFLPFKERKVGRQGIRLFNITYYDEELANIINSSNRNVKIKYNPRDMSTVFVETSDGKYMPVQYADLTRPPISLWEYQLVGKALNAQGRRTINEETIFGAIEAKRQILEQAQAASKAARRAAARLPNGELGEQRGGRRPATSLTRDHGQGHGRQRSSSMEEVPWLENENADAYNNSDYENWENEVL